MKKFFSLVIMCLLIAGGVFAEDFGTNGTKLTYEVQLTTEATVENRTDFPMYFAIGFWQNNSYCPVQLFLVEPKQSQKIITAGQKGNNYASGGFISCSYTPFNWCNSNSVFNNTHIIIKNITDKERELCENAEKGMYTTDDYVMFIWHIATANESQPQQVLFVRCFNNFDYLLLLDRMK